MGFRAALAILVLMLSTLALRWPSIPVAISLVGFPLILVAQYYAGLERWAVYFQGLFCLYGIIAAWRRHPRLGRLWSPFFGVTIAILGLMLQGLMHTTDLAYGWYKVQNFMIFGLVLTVGGALLCDTRGGLLQAAVTIGLVSMLTYIGHFVFLNIMHIRISEVARYDVLGNPIAIARYAGIGVLALVFLVQAKRFRAAFMLWGGAALVGIFVMVLTASRGPLLALLVSAIGAYGFRTKRFLAGLVAVAIIVVGAYVVVSVYAPPKVHDRLVGTARRDPTMSGRTRLWAEGVRVSAQRPLTGLGTGGFSGVVSSSSVSYRYPHNIYIELIVDHGLFGVLVAGVLTWYFIKYLVRCYRLRSRAGPMADFVIALAIYGFVNAQFSGDIPAQYALWFGCGTMVGLDRMYGVPDDLPDDVYDERLSADVAYPVTYAETE